MTNTLRRPVSPETRAAQRTSFADRYSNDRERMAAAAAALEAHRAEMDARYTVPTYRVPNSGVQLRVTGACPYCAGSMFALDLPAVDVEHPHVSYRGSIACLLCSRIVGRLEIGGGQPIAFRDLPAPKQGRPFGSKNTTVPRPPCRQCHERPSKAERRLCGPCLRLREKERAS